MRGHLGYSYLQSRPVTSVIGERVGPTVELMSLAIVVSLVVGIPLGIIAAVRRNTVVDYAATVLSLGAISVPPFFLGITAIYLFSLEWNILPSAGMSTPGTSSRSGSMYSATPEGMSLMRSASASIVSSGTPL